MRERAAVQRSCARGDIPSLYCATARHPLDTRSGSRIRDKMDIRRFDFVALGGGNAGLTAAARVAAAGRTVALVDRGPIGGLCSLNGCNPKKVLVRATEVLDEIRHAARHGIDVPEPRIDWARVIDRKETFTRPVTAATER